MNHIENNSLLSATPYDLGAKMLSNNIARFEIVNTPFNDSIRRKVVFGVVDNDEFSDDDQGYYVDFIFECMKTDKSPEALCIEFMSTPEIDAIAQEFLPLGEDVRYVDNEENIVKISLEYYLEETQEEANWTFEKILDKFTLLDNAIANL